MSNLLDFYISLPKPEQCPDFYVQGYTETLKLYPGTRVVPSESFVQDLNKKIQDCFKLTKFPCYLIPIFHQNKCYGFVLKGRAKCTPSYRPQTFRCLGLDSVQPKDTVFFVEGLKDTYLLKKAGYKVLPILSSVPSLELLRYLKKLDCRVVFISDNDTHREQNQAQFKKKIDSVGIPYLIINISSVKDLGEFFDDPSININCREKTISLVKEILKATHQWIKEVK